MNAALRAVIAWAADVVAWPLQMVLIGVLIIAVSAALGIGPEDFTRLLPPP